MKKLISLVIAVALFSSVQAQYVGDALRYSQNFPTLTARSMAMGGAFSSLGGDFSSATINPAGLGLYRKSEFVFSPSLSLTSTGSNFYSLHSNAGTDLFGDSNEDTKYQLNISNIGYVGTYLSGKDKGLVSASYFIGYNRMNNFNRSFLLSGINDSTSLVDAFLQDDIDDNDINGIPPEDLYAFGNSLAYETYLIDVIPASQNEYDTPVLLPVDQSKSVKTSGGVGHYTLGFGLNVSHIWYIGMNMGVYHISMKETTRHTEYNMATEATDFRNFTYNENLDVEGNGFSLSLGTMVRLFKIMRVGATLHLPTFYKIEELYFTSINSEFDNDTYYASSPDLAFRYKLTTPLRLQGGASVQLGKAGIIAADVEYINYSGMTLEDRDNDMNFMDANEDINNIYRPVLNIKLGGEARLMESLFVRLGGGYYPSAYASDEINSDASYTELTAGIGYRSSSFFIDFGFSSIFHKEKYIAYSAYNYRAPYNFTTNMGDLDQQTFRFVTSMGFRF